MKYEGQGIWRGEHSCMLDMEKGYDFLLENTHKHPKYRDEIWTIVGDMEKRGR